MKVIELNFRSISSIVKSLQNPSKTNALYNKNDHNRREGDLENKVEM